MRPVVISPGLSPKHSPRPTGTAGAICTITVLSLLAIRSHTASTSDLGVSAPVGQTLAHWPVDALHFAELLAEGRRHCHIVPAMGEVDGADSLDLRAHPDAIAV